MCRSDCAALWIVDADGLFKAGLDPVCPQCGGGLHLTAELVVRCYRCSHFRLELDGEGNLLGRAFTREKCDNCGRDILFIPNDSGFWCPLCGRDTEDDEDEDDEDEDEDDSYEEYYLDDLDGEEDRGDAGEDKEGEDDTNELAW